jgi:hypothetical protein
MSEQRFVKHLDNTVKDTYTKKIYSYASDMVGLLNEQQATIKQQEKIIKEQTLRTYCQDKEIQKLLQQIKELKEK